jgi:hypothetical protein
MKTAVSNTDSCIKTAVSNIDFYKPAVSYLKTGVNNTDCYIKTTVGNIKTDILRLDIPVVFVREI